MADNQQKFLQYFPVALAVALGVVAMFATGVGSSEYVDSQDYLNAARAILETGTYPAVGSLPFFRPPLYPGFIAVIWSIFPYSLAAIKVAQIVLNAGACFFVFKTAYAISKKRWAAFIGAMLFAVNPFFLYNAVAIQTEALHTFLITFALYLIIKTLIEDKYEVKTALAAGITMGFAALCRPSALGIGLLIGAVVFGLSYRNLYALRFAALLAIGIFLAVLPWSFYNLQTRGEFILINDAGGFALWAGNHPRNLDVFEGTFRSNEDAAFAFNSLGDTLARDQIREWEGTVGYAGLTFKQREALWRGKAWENATENPGVTARILGWKLFSLWKPFLNADIYSPAKVVASALVMVPLFAFGFWGLNSIRNVPQGRKIFYFFIALLIGVTLVHTVIVGFIRVRMPYTDPMLTVFAGIALNGLLLKYLGGASVAQFRERVFGSSGKNRTDLRHEDRSELVLI